MGKLKFHPRGNDPRRTYPNGPENHNGYQSVMYEARLAHDPYDQWGWALEWLGGIAEVMYFDLGESVPSAIYTPGACQSDADPENFAVEMVRECVNSGSTADDLRRALNVLDRFADMLKSAGHSY